MAQLDQVAMMKLVLAVHEKGSLTAAAEVLSVSPPTVVRQLALLEATLGVALFTRTTRKIHITNEGELYLEYARRILKELDALTLNLNARKGYPQEGDTQALSGHMVVTAPVQFGRMHVMPMINAFMARHPQVTVQLLLQDTLTDLVETGVDIAFRIGEVGLPDVVALPIGEVQRVVCASPEYLAQHTAIQVPADLNHAMGIKNTALNKGQHWKFNDHGQMVQVQPPIRFTTNDIDAAIQHCLAGLGVGVFLSYQVAAHLQSGRLVTLLADYQRPGLPVSIVYPQSKRYLARTHALIQFARSALVFR